MRIRIWEKFSSLGAADGIVRLQLVYAAGVRGRAEETIDESE